MGVSYLVGCRFDTSIAKEMACAYPDRIERHRKKKLIICQGSNTEGYYYIVLEGEVKISGISPDGKNFTLFVCVAPSIFGETAFINDIREFYAEALTDVTLLKLNISDTFPSSSLETKFLRELVKVACAKDYTKRKIVQPHRNISLKKILLNILEDLSRSDSKYSKKTERNGRLCVELDYTQQSIAEFAQASRVNVSKTLMELAQEGIIDTDKRKIYYYIS